MSPTNSNADNECAKEQAASIILTDNECANLDVPDEIAYRLSSATDIGQDRMRNREDNR